MSGPSVPQPGPNMASSIGPTLPAHLQDRAGAPPSSDEDEQDDYAPALPPTNADRKLGSQGPSAPPHLQRANVQEDESQSESDNEDDVGPLPPPAEGAAGPSLSAAEEFRLRERQKQDEADERKRAADAKPKREDWMLVPPSGFDLVGSVDPTKIKSKGFSQNSKRGGPAEKDTAEGRALWTETPEEKAKRLQEEVTGKRKRSENAKKQETDAEKRIRIAQEAHNEEMRGRVDSFNSAASRSESLVDQHAKKSRKDAEEEASKKAKSSKKRHRKASRSPSPPPPAFWDREKMMSAGRLMDEGKRQNIIGSSSTNLSSKFGGGKYL